MAHREKDARLFQRAAAQRLTAAELLLEHGFRLEAVYIAGYSVECSLKYLILKRTPRSRHALMLKKITEAGSKGHDFEFLKGIMQRPPVNYTLPKEASALLRTVASWSTDLRYQVGLVEYNVAVDFLAAARLIRAWVERA